MATNRRFEEQNLRQAESILFNHVIAREYFQGELYDRDGNRLTGITIGRQTGGILALDEATSGRLFMIPDGSVVWALTVREKLNAPAGLDVQSTNPFLAEGEQNSVIAFVDEAGPAMWVEALHIHRMVLTEDAPERFGTVAFGLMAVTAYRLGFAYIHLFAAGHGPLEQVDRDTFVGYDVWPKFGFDALVEPAELNKDPESDVKGCQTVQDVLAHNPDWWHRNGTARTMQFDLTADSRSWVILLNYLYEALVEDQP
jgi:hypothetical protein